ncbi:MAG: transporter substrate-binding domain-containing protein [Moraxellaceae bacterium]|nr:transporter substrate-binding domain-containing protein [Moraxellaceae bacterium]
MKLSSRVLWSAMALTVSVGLTACGGDKGGETADKAKADAKADTSGEVIKIATEGAYPPMNFTDKDGNLAGFDVDVANALCEQMKANCEIVAQDWEGIIPGLQSNKYDAIIAGMAITDERKQAVDFTDPYFSSGLLLIAKKDSDVGLDKLDGKTIGAQKSTVASDYLEEKNPDAKTQLYDTQDNANMDLVNGRVDAVLVDQVVGTDWLSKDEAKDFEQKGDTVSTGKDDFGIAIRKGDALAGKFNTALAEIKANGTYDKISTKYFGKKDAKAEEPKAEEKKEDK